MEPSLLQTRDGSALEEAVDSESDRITLATFRDSVG